MKRLVYLSFLIIFSLSFNNSFSYNESWETLVAEIIIDWKKANTAYENDNSVQSILNNSDSRLSENNNRWSWWNWSSSDYIIEETLEIYEENNEVSINSDINKESDIIDEPKDEILDTSDNVIPEDNNEDIEEEYSDKEIVEEKIEEEKQIIKSETEEEIVKKLLTQKYKNQIDKVLLDIDTKVIDLSYELKQSIFLKMELTLVSRINLINSSDKVTDDIRLVVSDVMNYFLSQVRLRQAWL